MFEERLSIKEEEITSEFLTDVVFYSFDTPNGFCDAGGAYMVKQDGTMYYIDYTELRGDRWSVPGWSNVFPVLNTRLERNGFLRGETYDLTLTDWILYWEGCEIYMLRSLYEAFLERRKKRGTYLLDLDFASMMCDIICGRDTMERISERQRKRGANINVEFCSTRLRITPEWSKEVDEAYRKEIHDAGEFEFYYGVRETPEKLSKITLNRNLFYAIYEREHNSLIGYVGLSERDGEWEPEIYIFRKYRCQGYGTEVLKEVMKMLFRGYLLTKVDGRVEALLIKRVGSTVRVENLASHRMMQKVGFVKNEEHACCFQAYINKENEEDCFFYEVTEYILTKENFNG